MKKLSLFLIALAMILTSCKPEAEKPTVVTKSVGEVTETSAKVVGQVTEDGGAEVTERGVCWSTTSAPEVIDYRMKDAEGGLGIYEVNVANLLPNTTYYVRAYATNEKGVSYGEELTLTTLKEIELPTVATAEVKDVTETTAVSGGEVVSDGGAEVTARGICWSTKHNPTLEDEYTIDGKGVGSFTSEMTDLEPDTKYYVRAYATNEKGTAYGEEVSFTTEEEEEPEEPGDEPEEPGDEPEEPGDEPEEPGDEPEEPGDEPEEPGDEPEEPGDEPEEPGDEPEEPGDEPEEPGDEPEEPGDEPENPGDEPEEPGDEPENPGDEPEEPEDPEQPEDPETPVDPEEPGDEPETPEQPEEVAPEVTTAEVTDITVSSATCGGEVTFDGNVTVTVRGICWNTTGTPTIEDNKTTDGEGIGSYTSNMTNLEHNTTYYVRAYAINEVGIAYGEEVSFTTLERNANGREYVDLGLSVKWATCNVGATTPEEYGDYFAWGETSTKAEYNTSNCPTYGLSYSSLQSQGYIDSEGNLTPQYDAATANWGGTWRMPTYAEFNELRNNCTWTWTTQNGVNGYNVEGPSGNSIFLPAAGFRDRSSLDLAGSYGFYWSSTPSENFDISAYYLNFDSDGHDMDYYYRSLGLSVRPILE